MFLYQRTKLRYVMFTVVTILVLLFSIFSYKNKLFFKISAILIALLLIIIFIYLINLLKRSRKEGFLDSKLHRQLILMFLSMLAIPTFFLALFTVTFIKTGMQSLFSDPVQMALQKAQNLSKKYLEEHQESIRLDNLSLGDFLKPQLSLMVNSPDEISDLLTVLSEERRLSEIMIFKRDGEILAKSLLTFSVIFHEFFIKILEKDMDRLDKGEIIVFKEKDRVRAVSNIDKGLYLFIGKIVPKRILLQINETKNNLKSFAKLKNQQQDTFFNFFVIFFALIFVILLIVIIFSLKLSGIILTPVQRLIDASKEISNGNLDIKVESSKTDNEFNILTKTFNEMVIKIKKQQKDLSASQKRAAWSDVARRVAHEIKNPLTPIQLAAERLRKKFLNKVDDDAKIFETCIETIIRQVQNIKNLVQEFSSFARMSEPKKELIDIIKIIKQTIFLQSQAFPEINFVLDYQGLSLNWLFDPQQFEQIITNLLKNSSQAIVESSISIDLPKVIISVQKLEKKIIILITDNGPGFVGENRDKLLEPYVTTRKKGTGLGLSIVHKIVAEHGGLIELSSDEGFKVKLTFYNDFNKRGYNV